MLSVDKITLIFTGIMLSFAPCFGIESKLPNPLHRPGEPAALNEIHRTDGNHYVRRPIFDEIQYTEVLQAQQRDDYCALLIAHHMTPSRNSGFDLDLSEFLGHTLNFSSPVPLTRTGNNSPRTSTSAESSTKTKQLTFDFDVNASLECDSLGPESNCVRIGYAVSVHSIHQFPEVFHDVIGALVAQSTLGPADRLLQREAGIHATLMSPYNYPLTSRYYHSNHPFNILDRDSLPFIATFYDHKFAPNLSRQRLRRVGETIYIDRFHTHIDSQTPIHSARDIIVADLEQSWLKQRFPEHRIVLRSHVVPTRYNGEIIVTYTRLFHGSWY